MKPPATTPGDIGDLFAGGYQNLSEADCAATPLLAKSVKSTL
jgi:hypothetical protein